MFLLLERVLSARMRNGNRGPRVRMRGIISVVVERSMADREA